jgi:hypothetical protein
MQNASNVLQLLSEKLFKVATNVLHMLQLNMQHASNVLQMLYKILLK